MAIVPLTQSQTENLKRSLEKEAASKQNSQKKIEAAPLPAVEKSPEPEVQPAAIAESVEVQAVPDEEVQDSTSYKSYKKRK